MRHPAWNSARFRTSGASLDHHQVVFHVDVEGDVLPKR